MTFSLYQNCKPLKRLYKKISMPEVDGVYYNYSGSFERVPTLTDKLLSQPAKV